MTEAAISIDFGRYGSIFKKKEHLNEMMDSTI